MPERTNVLWRADFLRPSRLPSSPSEVCLISVAAFLSIPKCFLNDNDENCDNDVNCNDNYRDNTSTQIVVRNTLFNTGTFSFFVFLHSSLPHKVTLSLSMIGILIPYILHTHLYSLYRSFEHLTNDSCQNSDSNRIKSIASHFCSTKK